MSEKDLKRHLHKRVLRGKYLGAGPVGNGKLKIYSDGCTGRLRLRGHRS
jgi:hypothetical protein